MILTKEFNTRLMALKMAGKKPQYTQAWTVLGEMTSGVPVSKSFRAENRIPNCYKYELPDGYRIVFQKVEGEENEFLALFVGSHDDAEHFLEMHKGWIFDPARHTLKELRWNSAAEEITHSVRSPELKAAQMPAVVREKVFQKLSDEQLLNSGLPVVELLAARDLNDPDSVEVMQLLERVPENCATLLLSYLAGSNSQREEVAALLANQRLLVPAPSSDHLDALTSNSDFFVQLHDIPEEKRAFEEMPFEDWMLYLHPDQKALVNKRFNGPARLRGVSGSGKTVVAIHRVREAARELISTGSPGSILFLTFNKSLGELVERLLRRLCTTAEISRVQVMTFGKWCQEYIRFRTEAPVGWNDNLVDSTWLATLRQFLPQLHQANLCMKVSSAETLSHKDSDIQFLTDEIDFIYGKFLHREAASYLTVERLGRGRRLGANQRSLILAIYTKFVEKLAGIRQRDSRELARIACTLLEQQEPPKENYVAVIVDEVQDLSDIELRIVKVLGDRSGSLFLVGDGAQQIYRRGQSLKSIGINIASRSFILKKNYRNTAEIVKAAMALKNAEGIGRFDEDPTAAQEDAIPSAVSGERPAVLSCPTFDSELALVTREVKYLVNKLGVAPSHICCMSRSAILRKKLQEHLNSNGMKVLNYRADGVGSDDAVLVSTLHNAKGHEFRAVFILGLNEGILPHYSATESEDVEREAALLYVAMTRAKELLYLSYSTTNSKGKGIRKSRFLDAMAANDIDLLDFTAHNVTA